MRNTWGDGLILEIRALDQEDSKFGYYFRDSLSNRVPGAEVWPKLRDWMPVVGNKYE